jgi:hypothetical protein
MTWEQQLEQKVEQFRAYHKDAEAKRMAATSEEDRVFKALKGYEAALEYERQRNGTESLKPDLTRTAPVQAESASTAVRAEPHTPVSEDMGDASRNKAGFIRDFIEKHKAVGVKPAEIYSAVQAAGIKLHRNYVYSVLQRGKAAGTVRERRGKYFPATEAETGTQGSA